MPSTEARCYPTCESLEVVNYLNSEQSAGRLNPGFRVNPYEFSHVKFRNEIDYLDRSQEFIDSLVNSDSPELHEFGLLIQSGKKTINSRELVPLMLKYYNLYDTVVFRQQSQYGTVNPDIKPSFAQQEWTDLVLPEHPLLIKYQAFKSVEYLHKKIVGSKSSKEDTGFESRLTKEGDNLFLHSPIAFHPTRTYHEYVYSLPYELRSCLFPLDPKEQFYYMDLHAAELCFYANISQDINLVDWINNGRNYVIDGEDYHFDFWTSLLYEIGFSLKQLQDKVVFQSVKPVVKKNVYSIIYSLSPNSMLPLPVEPENNKSIHTGNPFLMWFLGKCPRLRGKLLSIKMASNQSSTIQLWEGTKFDLSSHHNQLPAMLNYTAQAGLSQLTYRVIANLLHNGYRVYTFNFDSILIAAYPLEQDNICSIINRTYEKHGFKFTYKMTIGETYDEAQNHGTVVYPLD